MKFRLWREYGALNSKPIFDAFEHSLVSNGHTISNTDDIRASDCHVIWSVLFNGRMAPNENIWTRARTFGKPVIVLEVGGIKRGTTWKVALNGINRDAYFGDDNFQEHRSRKFNLKLKPWRTDGEHILICGQHDKSLQWQNMPRMSQWIMDTIEEIQKHTDRPIVFRPHPRCRLPAIEHQYKGVYRQEPKYINGTYDDFDMHFNNIYCTVSWSSNPGIHSIINGVPAIVGPSSLAYDVAGHNLELINYPQTPDRSKWLENYAHTEYTIGEIEAGIPLKRLTNKI
jgi:hypothetical protein